MAEAFWKRKSLSEMTEAEWESLCDGCGKCCLHKLQDVVTGEFYYTDVACRLLDRRTCRCTRYSTRIGRVPDCTDLRLVLADALGWLPQTCAYRLLAGGSDLPSWHPLVSGDPESVHHAGISVRGRVISEDKDIDLESRVVDWPR